MDNKTYKLSLLLDKFECMQKKHIFGVKSGNRHQLDLSGYNFERSQIFEELKNHLVHVMKETSENHDNSDAIAICTQKYDDIKKLDKILLELLGSYRVKLSRQKHDLNCGQKALKGYKGNANQKPRLISKPA